MKPEIDGLEDAQVNLVYALSLAHAALDMLEEIQMAKGLGVQELTVRGIHMLHLLQDQITEAQGKIAPAVEAGVKEAAIQALEEMRGAQPMSVDRITSLLTKGAVDGGYDVLGLSKDAPPPKEA